MSSPRLAKVRPEDRKSWPLISIIFAARDEEAEIGSALDSLTAIDYPSLEIIAVNDRSTDSTGSIIDGIASRDGRVRAVHIDTLPEGWLGKVNALERGFRESKGQWALFTDADVKLAPDTLKKALSFADTKGAEHVVLFPKLLGASYLLEVAFVAFCILFMTATRAFNIGNPGSKAFIGVGAFNLVRREALERSMGFEWLKMEVGDDIGLGMIMRDAGAKTVFAFAEMGVSLVWYENLPQMVRGMEKNMFSPAWYSYQRLAGMVALLVAFSISPVIGIMPWAPPAVKLLSALAFVLTVALAVVSRGLFISRATPYLLGPLGFMLVTFMILNSGLKCAKKGGIDWRGTFYSLDALRKGQRVRL